MARTIDLEPLPQTRNGLPLGLPPFTTIMNVFRLGQKADNTSNRITQSNPFKFTESSVQRF